MCLAHGGGCILGVVSNGESTIAGGHINVQYVKFSCTHEVWKLMFITSFLVPTLFTELQTCQVTHSRAQLDYYAFWFTPGFGVWTAFHTNLDRRMEMSHAVGHSFSSCARTILGPTTEHCVAIINAFIVSHTPKCTDSDDVYAVSQFENSVYCKPVQSSLLP